MKLQTGEQVILEVRRSRITWAWPFTKALVAGVLSFGYFYGLLWVTYDLTKTREGSFIEDKRIMSAAILGLTLILFLMWKIAQSVRRRRKARLVSADAPVMGDEALLAGLSDSARRRQVTWRIAINYRAEKAITIILVLAVQALILFAVEIGKLVADPRVAAIPFGAVVLTATVSFTYFSWHHTRYCLTSRRLVTVSGWLAQTTWEVPLSECRHIEAKRNLWQKMLGYGHLSIAGTGSIAEHLTYVPQPDTFRSALLDGLTPPEQKPEPEPEPEPRGEAPIQPVAEPTPGGDTENGTEIVDQMPKRSLENDDESSTESSDPQLP